MKTKVVILFINFLLCFSTFNLYATEVVDEVSFRDLEAITLAGERVNFARYSGKVILISNIALKCGTTPQLHALQKIYSKYKSKGLVVLGFPTNDFSGDREPTDSKMIRKTCKTSFGTSFPIFRSGAVRGIAKHEVFDFLTSTGREGLRGEVGFNFEKFLVDRYGRLRYRFGPFTSVESDLFQEELAILLAEA